MAEAQHHPSRRTVAAGTAWSVPVLIVGVPAHATNASMPCPQLPGTASGWTTSIDGTLGAGVTEWNTTPLYGPDTFAFTSEADNVGSGTATVTTSAMITVVKGVSYSFATLSIGGGPKGNSTVDQSLTISIDNQKLFTGSTNVGTISSSNGQRQSYPATGSYQAPADGTVTVKLTFTLTPPGPAGKKTDNISIALPTLTCS